MPGKNRERIQIYVVTGLALVFVILGYFQLFHKKTDAEAKSIAQVESEPEFNLSSIEPKIKSRLQVNEESSFESFQPISRNIFTSLKSPAKAEVPKMQKEKLKPLPPLKLKGTIVEDDRSIAIVNDKYLRIGDLIDGFEVVWIGKKEVLLDSGQRQMVLEILKNE